MRLCTTNGRVLAGERWAESGVGGGRARARRRRRPRARRGLRPGPPRACPRPARGRGARHRCHAGGGRSERGSTGRASSDGACSTRWSARAAGARRCSSTATSASGATRSRCWLASAGCSVTTVGSSSRPGPPAPPVRWSAPTWRSMARPAPRSGGKRSGSIGSRRWRRRPASASSQTWRDDGRWFCVDGQGGVSRFRSPLREERTAALLGAALGVTFTRVLRHGAGVPPDPGPGRVVPVAGPSGGAVPAEPGRPRHDRPGEHPAAAGQALGGLPEALRVAPGSVGRPCGGASVPAPARGWIAPAPLHRHRQHQHLPPVALLLPEWPLRHRLDRDRIPRGAHRRQAGRHPSGAHPAGRAARTRPRGSEPARLPGHRVRRRRAWWGSSPSARPSARSRASACWRPAAPTWVPRGFP